MWGAKDTNDAKIDKWIEYLKTSKHGCQLIEMCDNRCGLNAMHISVIRNKIHLLERLASLGAGMCITVN